MNYLYLTFVVIEQQNLLKFYLERDLYEDVHSHMVGHRVRQISLFLLIDSVKTHKFFFQTIDLRLMALVLEGQLS